MAYEGHFLPVRNHLFGCPCEGIQAAGKKNGFVGRKLRMLCVRQGKIGVHRGWSFEVEKLKLILVVGKETNCLDEGRYDSIGRPQFWLTHRDRKSKFSTPY